MTHMRSNKTGKPICGTRKTKRTKQVSRVVAIKRPHRVTCQDCMVNAIGGRDYSYKGAA